MPKSLYERLGGWNGIATVVDDFIDKLKTDYLLNENPYVREANKNSVGVSIIEGYWSVKQSKNEKECQGHSFSFLDCFTLQ